MCVRREGVRGRVCEVGGCVRGRVCEVGCVRGGPCV